MIPKRPGAVRLRSLVSADRILKLFDAKDLDGFVEVAFGVVRDAVACDFASAFYRTSPKGLLKARDSRGRRYSHEFMRRHVELNPAIPLVAANPGIKVVPTRTGLRHSERELRGTSFYREIMKPLGWRHSVALCFWGNPPAGLPVFVLSAERSEGRHDFSNRDITTLQRLHPFLQSAVNRLHERESAQSLRDGMAISVRDGCRGLAVLDLNLHLVEAHSIARRLAAVWGDTPAREKRTWELPAELAQACRQMREEWESLSLGYPDAISHRGPQIHHPRVKGLTASVTMVCRNTSGLSDPAFLIEFERRAAKRSVRSRTSVPILQHLTLAERAVALILSEGLSNQEIADRLEKSVDAVKFLLHRIYKKTGVPSRAALVAVMRG